MMHILPVLVSVVLVLIGFVRLLFAFLRTQSKRRVRCSSKDVTLAFFHPYCASGGGGERVLWVGVPALFESCPEIKHITVYAGDEGMSKSDILTHVKNRFGISFTADQEQRLSFVFIKSRTLLEAKWYPVCTMLFQSLASILVGLECILRFTPDIYCDTMGAAFTYPAAYYLTGAKIIAYVHYPIISTDMLNKVREMRPTYNNASNIASSVTVSSLKLLYYQVFARVYSWVGQHAQVVMVNSTWTKQHVAKLWWYGQQPPAGEHNGTRSLALVYPPCNTSELLAMPLAPTVPAGGGKRIVLSIAQFRPEKDHMLQIRAMKCLMEGDARGEFKDVELVIMGSTRHRDDELLLQALQETVREWHLQDHVRFVANGTYSELKHYMSVAQIGLHTMWNEHFGISVVELMAAGLVVIAHNSGGPKLDIIPDPAGVMNGYLAETPEEYAQALRTILSDYDGHLDMRKRARVAAVRFSDELFSERFAKEFHRLL